MREKNLLRLRVGGWNDDPPEGPEGRFDANPGVAGESKVLPDRVVGGILAAEAQKIRLRSQFVHRNAAVHKRVRTFGRVRRIVAMVVNVSHAQHSDARRTAEEWDLLR